MKCVTCKVHKIFILNPKKIQNGYQFTQNNKIYLLVPFPHPNKILLHYNYQKEQKLLLGT